MEQSYFMHLDSRNLANYYSCACLKPSRYFTNRIDDIQNKFDAFILLSEKRYAKDMDCSLEVVLDVEEQKNLICVNSNRNIFLLNNAIPITRVKRIYFLSDNTRDKIVTLVNMSSAFIPDGFATVIVDENLEDYYDIELSSEIIPKDLSESIRKFDSLLGGFALMRLSAEENVNYPENYFSTLSRFNSVVETELLNANKKVSDIYWDAFEGKNKFKHLYPFINKKLSENDLNDIVRKEGQRIQKNRISGIIDINSLDKGSYIIAVLFTYGIGDEGRKNKIDGLILNNFRKDVKLDKSEVIALCYGLNRGYSVFSNKYRISTTEKIVKFELESKLDYYTIESLYQFAFNGPQKSSDFPYLDSWCPKLPAINRKLKKSEYIVLDKIISSEVIKVGSAKWWSNFMQFFFQKNSEDLVKPFLVKVFEKIKSDIDEESVEIITEKNLEITTLKESNNQLQRNLAEIDNFIEKITALELEIASLKTKNISVVENVIQNVDRIQTDLPNAELLKKYELMQKLIKELNRQTSMKKAHELINKFNEDDSNETPVLFPEIS